MPSAAFGPDHGGYVSAVTADSAQSRTGLPRAIVLLLGIAGAVVALAGVKSCASLIGPAMLALVLTVGVHPLHRRLCEKGFPSWAAVATVLTAVYGILLGLVAALVVSLSQFATILPTYRDKFDQLLAQGRHFLEQRGVGQDQVQKALNVDGNRVFSVVGTVLSSTVGVFSALVLIITLLLFMTLDATTYHRRMDIVARMRPDVATALHSFAAGTRKYLVVSTVFGAIVAVLDTAALWAIGIPLPLLWGLLAFITNYIPNIGFVLGLAPPALLALLESGPMLCLIVIVVYSVLNFVVQTVIQPKFVGDTADVSVTVAMFSLVFWGWILGALGALLAIPLTLLAKALLIDTDPALRWMGTLISSKVTDPDDETDDDDAGAQREPAVAAARG
jgi:AI-2 transport protein TqsA